MEQFGIKSMPTDPAGAAPPLGKLITWALGNMNAYIHKWFEFKSECVYWQVIYKLLMPSANRDLASRTIETSSARKQLGFEFVFT